MTAEHMVRFLRYLGAIASRRDILISGIPDGYSSKAFAYLLVIVAYMDQLQPLPRYEETQDAGLQAIDDGWPSRQLAIDYMMSSKLVTEVKNSLRHFKGFSVNLNDAENALHLWSRSCMESRLRVPVTDVPPPMRLAVKYKGISSSPSSRKQSGAYSASM